MTRAAAETLRRAAAHVLVDDIEAPAPDEATLHHLFRVLRVRDGDVVTATDGSGAWRVCRPAGDKIVADGPVDRVERSSESLTVAFAIPKADRPEWIVQKLTELGVDRITLLHASRSVVTWKGDRARRHLERLGRVAIEAMQQSRGVWLPVIEGPVAATDVLPTAMVAEPGGRRLTPADRTIAIGPEGGWTENELALAADRVDLGPTVLRVETAAVVAASWVIGHST